MNSDEFMKNLSKLLAYKIKQFKKHNSNYSLYGDLWAMYEDERKEEFEVFRKKYVAAVGSRIEIEAFELKLLDIVFDLEDMEEGNVRLIFMLDIARLFREYDANYTLPFYTMLKVSAEFDAYFSLKKPLNLKLDYLSDLDKGLLNRTDTALLERAASELGQELTFLALKAS